MHDPDCIFCKIAAGSIPSLSVFESDACLAFLDINPLAPGHTLLIPKLHCRDIRDVPADVLTELTSHLPSLAEAVIQSVNATGLNLLQNTGASSGQAVFHLHFHLIPRIEHDGLGYRWNAGQYEPGQAEAMQKTIRTHLEE